MKKILFILWTYWFNPMYSPLDLLILPIFWILMILNSGWWFFGVFLYLIISVYMTNKYFKSATLKED